MELLSYPDLTVSDKQSIDSLLKNMTYLPISPEIEDETIKFRRTQLYFEWSKMRKIKVGLVQRNPTTAFKCWVTLSLTQPLGFFELLNRFGSIGKTTQYH